MRSFEQYIVTLISSSITLLTPVIRFEVTLFVKYLIFPLSFYLNFSQVQPLFAVFDMRLSTLSLLAGLAASVAAEDVLFVDTFEYEEYKEATTTLGLTAKVVTEAEWQTMSTSDFAKYKAIVLADPACSSDPTILTFLSDTKATWGPAIEGNMVLIGKRLYPLLISQRLISVRNGS